MTWRKVTNSKKVFSVRNQSSWLQNKACSIVDFKIRHQTIHREITVQTAIQSDVIFAYRSEVPPMVIIQNFNNGPSKTPRSTFTNAVTARDIEPDVANMSDFDEEDEWDSDPPPPKKSVTIAPPPGTIEGDDDDDW